MAPKRTGTKNSAPTLAASATSPLRRSPRKALPSAKKATGDEALTKGRSPSKSTKKASSPAKSPLPSKLIKAFAKSVSPVKKAVPAKKPKKKSAPAEEADPPSDDEEPNDGAVYQTPAKRGRGRPRKTPPADGTGESSARSPSKSPAAKSPSNALKPEDATKKIQLLVSTLGEPQVHGSQQVDQDTRKAYFVLRSTFFGGGSYQKAPKGPAKGLKQVWEQHVAEEGFGGLVDVAMDDAAEKRFFKRVPHHDFSTEYQMKRPYPLNKVLQELGGFDEDDAPAPPVKLLKKSLEALSAVRYGMGEAPRGHSLGLTRLWHSITQEDADQAIADHKYELAMWRRIEKRLADWSTEHIVPSIETESGKSPTQKGQGTSQRSPSRTPKGSHAGSAAKGRSKSPDRGQSASPGKKAKKPPNRVTAGPFDPGHGFELLQPAKQSPNKGSKEEPSKRASRTLSPSRPQSRGQGKANGPAAKDQSPTSSRKPSGSSVASDHGKNGKRKGSGAGRPGQDQRVADGNTEELSSGRTLSAAGSQRGSGARGISKSPGPLRSPPKGSAGFKPRSPHGRGESRSPSRSPRRGHSPPHGSAESIEQGLRMIATADEQRMRDQYENAIVELPEKKRKRAESPEKRAKSPSKKAKFSEERAPSPGRRAQSSGKRGQSPEKKAQPPSKRAGSPAKRALSPSKKKYQPTVESISDEEDSPDRSSTKPSGKRSPGRERTQDRSPRRSASPKKRVSRKASEASAGQAGADEREYDLVNGKLVPVGTQPPLVTRPSATRKRSSPIRGGAKGPIVRKLANRDAEAPESPSKRRKPAVDDHDGASRGDIDSVVNPPTIPGTDKKPNPFYEPMPAPEVWHRRMPNVFPFGETPFMEREMSRQINEDLARGHDKDQVEKTAARRSSGILDSAVKVARGAYNLVMSPVRAAPPPEAPQEQSVTYRSPWQLPEVSDEEVERALILLQGGGTTGRRPVRGRRLRASADATVAGHLMSGGLGARENLPH